MNFKKHLINSNSTIRPALKSLCHIVMETTIIAINDRDQLILSPSDGDIRRGLLKGIEK